MEFNFNDIEYLACELPEGIKCWKYAGMYDKEIEAIDYLLTKKRISDTMRRRLELEKVLAQGMDEDYRLTFDEALNELRNVCPEVTAEELNEAVLDGRADWRLRNGEICFQDDFVASIQINSPELFHRGPKPADFKPAAPSHAAQMMMEKGSYGLRHHIRHTIWCDDREEFEGRNMLVHIPLPIETDAQSNIVIHSATDGAYISPASAKQRTASWKVKYEKGLRFTVDYSFDITMKYVKPDPACVSDEQPADFTGEDYPHIRFTPYLRSLCAEIVGGEKNPLLKARKIYDYITANLKYSYMREYLLLETIPEFAALNFRGDCGVQALLFITLCRIAGIGAQWQSGLSIGPTYVGSHDWARYYIAPYGWLYCDLSRGQGAFQRGELDLWNFSFSSVEPMRCAANSSFQAQFDPPKKYIRIDPYDNQTGEIEFDHRGLRCGEVHRDRELISTEEI